MNWTWLNPEPAGIDGLPNNASMVIRIECAPGFAGDRRILLCGDIEGEAMKRLLRDGDSIEADVVELPHHGSHHAAAERFIDQIDPTIVMQSTGWTRWKRDKWAAALAARERLVTARDGACWVEIQHDGRITSGRFLDTPYLGDEHE
jgi:beta-lactamase superfamily II metal-dependent hydrolase